MSTQSPKAVVFDLGKVVLDFDYGIAARTLAPLTRMDTTAVRTLIDQSPLLQQFETGLMTTPELFEFVVRETGYRGDLASFRDAFGNIFAEIEPMVNLHREIRAAGIPTHVLSNTNEIAVGHIRERFPFFAGFDTYIFSHEVRSMKPATAIYEALESSTGLSGSDLLYIDDRAENIDAGLARGWQSILHHDPAITVPEVWRRLNRAGR